MAGTTTRMRLTTTAAVAAIIAGGFHAPASARPAAKVKISITDVAITEGNTGTSKAVFTVHAGGKGFRESSVQYRTVDATAAEGDDYVISEGNVSFADGRNQSVRITINGDVVDEANETFFVNLSRPIKAAIIDARGVGTILNDDVPTDGGTGGGTDGGTGGGLNQGDGSGGTSTGKAATRITLKIRKRSGIVARGWLFPAHAGKRVVVKLRKKVNGRFVLVRKHRPVLGRGVDVNGDGTRESKYRTSFKKPRAKRCRVVVKFFGDGDHKVSTARRTFYC